MSDPLLKSFLTDLAHAAVVPASRVVRSAEVAHVGGRSVLPKAAAAIELVKEGDIVRAIDVTCECGHRIRIWCSYETDAEKQRLG